MKSDYLNNVKVYVQIKPGKDFHSENVKILIDKKSLCVRTVQDFSKHKKDNVPHYRLFKTDGIFYSDPPEDIYKTITKDLTQKYTALKGINSVIIGYGQTGTGKSTTMHGLHSVYKNRGISLRILTELLDLQHELKNESLIHLEASFVEVQRDYVIDLFSERNNKVYRPYTYVTKLAISSIDDGIAYLFFGDLKRSAHHELPYISHSASSIFTIHIKKLSLLNSDPVDKYSKIHIVDLSGADKVGNTSCYFKTGREIGVGNLVKSQLESIMLIFHKFQIKNDKTLRGMGCLVEYLSDSLKPHNLLRFIAHISTSQENLSLTLSHLRFAQVVGMTSPAKLVTCVKSSEQRDIENMKKRLEYYTEQNYLTSMVLNEDLTSSLTAERTEQIRSAVEDFINSKTSNIALLNVSDAQAVLDVFKELYKTQETELHKLINEKNEISLSKKSISETSQTSVLKSSSTRVKQSKSSKTIRTNRASGSVNLDRPEKSTKKTKGSLIDTFDQSRKSSIQSKSKQDSSDKFTTISKSHISIQTVDDPEFVHYLKVNVKNYEDVWNTFTQEETYQDMYANLKIASKEYMEVLNQYNDVIVKIRQCCTTLEDKNNYIQKIQFFKDNTEAACYNNEDDKLKSIENDLECCINAKKSEINELKEQLLTLQAEMKITIANYYRIKKDIGDYFIKYCRDTLNIYLGSGEQNIDDDKLLSEDKQEQCTKQMNQDLEEEKRIEIVFIFFQTKINKVIAEKNAALQKLKNKYK